MTEPWEQTIKDVRKSLDEAAENVIVRPSVAIHHLLCAVAGLTTVVEDAHKEVTDETD